jgi:hypothetical protein
MFLIFRMETGFSLKAPGAGNRVSINSVVFFPQAVLKV